MIDHKKMAADVNECIRLFGIENAAPSAIAYQDLRRLVKEYFDARQAFNDSKEWTKQLSDSWHDTEEALRASIGEAP